MIRRLLFAILGVFLLGAASVADAAKKEEGIPVTVQVVDATTLAPISTAVIRHPQEQQRHRVNAANGEWTESVLYLPDGAEMYFTKGLELELEVSAPGYQNVRVTYMVKKRKNLVQVALVRMVIDMSADDPEDIVIEFGRDKPIEFRSDSESVP